MLQKTSVKVSFQIENPVKVQNSVPATVELLKLYIRLSS